MSIDPPPDEAAAAPGHAAQPVPAVSTVSTGSSEVVVAAPDVASGDATVGTGAGPSRGSIPGPVVTLVGLAAGLFVLAAMQGARDIVAPTVLALVIAMAVSPMRSWLAARLPGAIATITTIVITFTVLLAFVATLVWALYSFANEIRTYQSDLDRLITDISARLEERGLDDQAITDLLAQIDLGQAADVALSVVQSLYGAVTVLTLALTLLFFILIDGGSFASRFVAVSRIRPSVGATLSNLSSGVRRYVNVTTVFGLIVAVADVILLVILDVPLPLVWGVLAFLTGYIPTIGLIIGLVPPVIIALLENGWVNALIVLIGYLLVNNVIQSVIQPKFVGDAVGLNIASSFFSLVLWGYVLGTLGALLAIPMSLIVKALLSDSDPRHTWLGMLLGDKAPPEEDIVALAAAVRTSSR